jgi:hypothetical protein
MQMGSGAWMSPGKTKEEKEGIELHSCPYTSIVFSVLPYPSEMSSINFGFSDEIMIFLSSNNPSCSHRPHF